MTTKKVHIAWTPPKVEDADGNYTEYSQLKHYEIHHNMSEYPSPAIIPADATSTAPGGMTLPVGNYHVGIQAVSTTGYKSEKAITKFKVGDGAGQAKRRFGVCVGGVLSSPTTITDGTFNITAINGWSFAGAGASQVISTFATGEDDRFEQDCTSITTQNFSTFGADEQAIKSHYILFDYSEADDPWKLVKWEDTVFSSTNNLGIGYWYDTGTGNTTAENTFVETTGAVSVNAGSNIVTGTGTDFVDEYEVNDIIYFSSTRAAKVTYIESDVVLYMDRAFSTATSVAGTGSDKIKRQGLRIDINYDSLIYIIRNNNNTFEKYAIELDVDSVIGTGQGVRQATIYKLNDTTLATNNFGTFIDPLYQAEAGWSLSAPALAANLDKVYSSTRIFTSDGLDPQEDTWSIPVITAIRNDGTSLYTWIRYAENATGSVGFTATYEEGTTTYIGHKYNQASSDSSGSVNTEYVWSLLGATGATGPTLYTWIRYAENASGSIGFTATYEEGVTIYIGHKYNQTSSDSSNSVYGDYVWSLFEGPAGVGPAGLNTGTAYLFQVNNSNSTPPGDPTGASGLTFTYATGLITEESGQSGNLNGWTNERPATSETNLYRWIIAGPASSNTVDDIITPDDWASAVLDSAEGFQTATVYLYQRSDDPTIPAEPNNNLTWNFADKKLDEPDGHVLKDGWTEVIPDNSGDYIFVTTAIALAVNSDTEDIILPGDWADPTIFTNVGSSVDIIFRKQDTAPGTPSPSSGVPGPNDSTADVQWYPTVTAANAVNASIDPMWSSVGTKIPPSILWIWQTPIKMTGVDADSRVELTIYNRTDTEPATPPSGLESGHGSYNFTTRTLTLPSSNIGEWKSYIAAGNAAVWSSNAVAAIEGKEGTDEELDWSDPIEISGKIGKGIADGYVYFQDPAPESEKPDAPTVTGVGAGYHIIDRIFTGLTSTWDIDPPSYGVETPAVPLSNKYWYCSYHAIEDASGDGSSTGSNLTFGLVKQGIGFTNLVTFDTDEPDTAPNNKGRTQIDGGWITTKQIKSKTYVTNSETNFANQGVKLDLEATGTENILEAKNLYIQANGSATFSGDIAASSIRDLNWGDEDKRHVWIGEGAEISGYPASMIGQGTGTPSGGSYNIVGVAGTAQGTAGIGGAGSDGGYGGYFSYSSDTNYGADTFSNEVHLGSENYSMEAWGPITINRAAAWGGGGQTVLGKTISNVNYSVHGAGAGHFEGNLTTSGLLLCNTLKVGTNTQIPTTQPSNMASDSPLYLHASKSWKAPVAAQLGSSETAGTRFLSSDGFSTVWVNAPTGTLPSQSDPGTVDKFLQSDGETASWETVSGSGGGAHYDNDDVDTHLNQDDPTAGYVLSWDGDTYEWVAQSGGSGNVTLTGTQTLTNKTLTSPVFDTGVSGTAILNSNTMANTSATKLASSSSIKAYVDNTVSLSFIYGAIDTRLNLIQSGGGNPTSGYVLSWTSGAYAWVANSGSGGSNYYVNGLSYAPATRILTAALYGTTNQTVTLPDATTSAHGLMTDTQFDKLADIAAGATANTGTVTSVTGTASQIASSGGTAPVISLTNTAVSPSTYGNATKSARITIDQQGRITAASEVTISGGGGGGGDANVQSNWTQTASGDDSYILNKPTVYYTAAISNAEVRTAVEAADNSNVFTDTDHSKLNGIEDNATDTLDPHYTEAIAVGDGGLTQKNFTTALNTKLGGIEDNATDTLDPHYTEAIAVGDGGLTQKNFTTALNTKLGGIADNATNTLAPHYTAAIAVGDGGLTQKNFTTALNTKLTAAQPVATTDSVTFANVTAGEVTATSDIRLKTDVKTIENALDKVSNMRGVTFTRAEGASSGVIAQELEKVAPELVKDGEYKAVAYGNLVGYLIEAIKELKDKVEELENGNSSL